MGIVANSNVPNLVIQLNVIDRGISYRGLVKTVPDNFWDNEVKPKMYPAWDTDKDRLIEFTWYDNNTYHCIRRKNIKNFKTGLYEWVDYEMEQSDVEAAKEFYEFLKDTFLRMEQILNEEFQEELGRIYGEVRSESWLSIRLARNFLLQETDFIFACSDVYMPEEEKARYALYRQKLRELPTIFADKLPSEIFFPMSPQAYTALYKDYWPDNDYLETDDKWIKLGSFFYTTFKEKMIKYLSVRDITDQLYSQAFIRSLGETPYGPGGYAWKGEAVNKVAEFPAEIVDAARVISELDGLLGRIEELEKAQPTGTPE